MMPCIVALFLVPPKPAPKVHKPAIVLNLALTGIATWDGYQTRQSIKAGAHEVDPIARVFIGPKPTWARMAPFGAAEVIGSAWLATKMRNSKRWRRVWWVPQVALIGAHAYGIASSR
jgi:hypothetical protein